MENLNTSLTLISILLLILLLFCFMQHYIYNSQPIIYTEPKNKYNKYNKKNTRFNKINKNNELKLIKIKKNIIILINKLKKPNENNKNNFKDIPVEDIQAYYDTLSDLDNNVKEFQKNDMHYNIVSTQNFVHNNMYPHTSRRETMVNINSNNRKYENLSGNNSLWQHKNEQETCIKGNILLYK